LIGKSIPHLYELVIALLENENARKLKHGATVSGWIILLSICRLTNCNDDCNNVRHGTMKSVMTTACKHKRLVQQQSNLPTNQVANSRNLQKQTMGLQLGPNEVSIRKKQSSFICCHLANAVEYRTGTSHTGSGIWRDR